MAHPGIAFRLALGFPENLVHRQAHIVIDTEPRQQAVILKNHCPVRTGVGDLLVLQQNAAGGRFQQAGDDIQHGRFAAAGMPDQGHELTLRDSQVDSVEHIQRALVGIEGHADMINLMTLHAAKGLEFPHVYLIGFEEGLLPHQTSIDEENVEEERRLAYVGITRAQRQLTISYTGKRRRYGEDLACEPSRFLEELPREHLQFSDEIPVEVKKETGRANLENLKAILDRA